MKNLARIVLLGIVLFSAVMPAHAFVVDLSGTNADRIRDLEIDGTAYDVAFEFVDASTAAACGSTVPCDVFFGNGSGALAAVTAINFALNDAGAESVGTGKISYFVPWSSNGADSEQGTYINDTMWVGIGGLLDPADTIEYARFSPAVVPIPAAAWLFGSALGILGWIRRRTSNHSLS